MEQYLSHYGILGQKWGIRRFQNPDGSLTPEGYKRYAERNISKARAANLEKWGKTEENNVLYIAGYSGSGKSTTAKGLAKPGDKIIHLDVYSEPNNDGHGSNLQSAEFNAYLNKHSPRWKEIANATRNGENGSMKRYSKEYWDAVDSFANSIEGFSKEQFHKGDRVLVEGVQIADDWLHKDKSWYAGKSAVILGTNPISSFARASARDEKTIKSVQEAKEYIQWYVSGAKRLNDMADSAKAVRGKKIINELLKTL